MLSIRLKWLSAVAVLAAPLIAHAADVQSEIEQMKAELQTLRQQVNTRESTVRPSSGGVERALDSKYGPQATVTTKNGKLTIHGLVHVWYQAFQKDNNGLFAGAGPAPLVDTNEGQDNNGFRIRRSELMFVMDIHENITATVLIDPTAEAGSFPLVTDNQGLHKRANNVAPEFDAANGPGLGSTGQIRSVQGGSGGVPGLLEDAFINYHGVIPHHDFTIGQFKPQLGEESIRSSAALDFVERSFVGLQNDTWDLGAAVHGTWWDDRFQYTVGVMDGAGNLRGSAGSTYNRADDNDQKDGTYRVLVRPLWGSSDCECSRDKWGKMELGFSGRFGRKGESGGPDSINSPINGLNRRRTWSSMYDAWGYYAPGGPLTGLWLRGEWALIKDRNAPGTVADDSAAGGTDLGNTGSGSGQGQSNGKPFTTQGFYGAIGYKLSDSIFRDDLCGTLRNVEFAFRYDSFQNVEIADLVRPDHTDVYKTDVYTGGVTYYIKGNNARIQANYNAVRDPSGNSHNFHNVRNDSFVISFQVAF